MAVCICEACIHRELLLEGEEPMESCRFGFPDESCADCDGERDCGFSCEHFEALPQPELRVVHCSVCGKALEQAYEEGTDLGTVYCPSCYLARK